MKIKILIIPFLLVVQTFAFCESLFENASNLKQISTKYFTIIFPLSSSNTVKRLVSFADREYERLAEMFGMNYIEKLIIVVTPDVEFVNGMFSSLPYNQIVLYDYLDDASILPFYDYFYDLFLHELTHAVSLNLRNGFWHFLRKVFGTYISPHEWQVPYWMIEGVTVSMESYDGDGRSNDPRSKALLAQHLLEGKFQRIDQVSQARPYPKKGNLPYIYGGLFNTYLQKKYGWEKYKRLWQNNNNLIIPYTFWFSFTDIYDITPDSLWNTFSLSFILDNVKNPETKVIDKGIFNDMKSDRENIYYSDSKKSKIFSFNPENNKKHTLLDQDGDFSIDKDKGLLYVKEIQYPSKTYKSVTRVFDIKKRQFLKENYPKMTKFSIDSKGNIVGIEATLHSTDLIFISNNSKQTLLKGNEYLFFDSPVFLNDEKIAFLIILSNDRRIAILDKQKNVEIFRFNNIWIDEIYNFNDKIMFTFYHNDKISLSRLGFLDIETSTAYFQNENFNGGINKPVIIGSNLFYIKKLSDEDKIVLLKDYFNHIKFDTNRIEKQSFNLPDREDTNENNLFANIDNYNPFPYILPSFWVPFAYPYPLDRENFVTVIGFYAGSSDPISENTYSLYFNSIGDPFRNDSIKQAEIEWQNSSFPVDLIFSIGIENYLYTNYISLSGTIEKSFMFQSGKSAFQSYFGANSITANLESWKNTLTIGTGFYYNYIQKMPIQPYNFSVSGRLNYEIETNALYFDGNLGYNTGWFFVSTKGGIANVNRYYLGKNIPFWGNYPTLLDESKLSSWYISHEEGFFLRLDTDLGIGLFPVYLNYFGISCGYRGVFTGEEYFSTIFAGIYPGTILFYAIAFNPGFELNYFIERKLFLLSFSLNMNF